MHQVSQLADDAMSREPFEALVSRIRETSDERRALLGSYFLQEYAVEAAGLFNPSPVVVDAIEGASDTAVGVKLIIALRSVGEGHVSSVSFREATVSRLGESWSVDIDPEGDALLPLIAPVRNARVQLTFLGPLALQRFGDALAEGADLRLSPDDASAALEAWEAEPVGNLAPKQARATELLECLVRRSGQVEFDRTVPVASRVIFPFQGVHAHGIEDCRFVAVFDDDEKSIKPSCYMATATAYDGHHCRVQLIHTVDFSTFTFTEMTGHLENKGFALFPRRVNGFHWMLSRNDDRCVMIMRSPSPFHWPHAPQVLLEPMHPWEFFKMGNCGSPIETPHGWLVLTHGVGPLRTYGIGAAVLQLDDPSCVIGRLREPLIPAPLHSVTQRHGYVPNVVYSCGAVLIGGTIFVTYAECDQRSKVLAFPLNVLLTLCGVPS